MNTKIRELKYSDRLKLSAMIRKLTEKLEDDTLLKLVSSSDTKKTDEDTDENDNNFIKIGISIFKLLMDFLEDEMSKWFADLCNVDINEFIQNAPFDIEITIIDQLLEDKGKFKSFLAGASRLYNRISGLRSKLQNMKEK